MTDTMIRKDAFRYQPGHNLTFSSAVTNIVPGDFNHDGRLDLLIMHLVNDGSWWGGKDEKLTMEVYLGAENGAFREQMPRHSQGS